MNEPTDSSADDLLHHVAVFALCHGTLGMPEGEAMKAIRDLIICRVQLPTTMLEFRRSAGYAIQALESARAS